MKRGLRLMSKQNVFVPEYPGRPVFDQYNGIPHDEYLKKTKEAVDKFVSECDKCGYSIEGWQSHGGVVDRITTPERVTEVKTMMNEKESELEIFAGGTKWSIRPTKWGVDRVGLVKLEDRLWLFDERNCMDVNLVRHKL